MQIVHPKTGAPLKSQTYDGMVPTAVPRELTRVDIVRVIRDYVHAAQNAMRAGFDGVEVRYSCYAFIRWRCRPTCRSDYTRGHRLCACVDASHALRNATLLVYG